jgi:uncharacterized membrane protein YqiK
LISTYFSGMARTAEIVRDARIGEAEANRDAQIEVAIAEEQRLASKLANKTEVERSKRDYEVKKAAYDAEVETVRAEAELAFKLQVNFYKSMLERIYKPHYDYQNFPHWPMKQI